MEQTEAEIIALTLLAGPNRDGLQDPYEHLSWRIIAKYRSRMPILAKFLKSDAFLSVFTANKTPPFIRDPESNALYFHRSLIKTFNAHGREWLKLLDQKGIEPRNRKRTQSPTPITVETIESDYAFFCQWIRKELYQKAKKESQRGGKEGGDQGQVLKRKHSSYIQKAKRFAQGLQKVIMDGYEWPDDLIQAEIVRAATPQTINDSVLDHAKMLLKERLKMSAETYQVKYHQKRPRNLFEEYINARLRHAHMFLSYQAPST